MKILFVYLPIVEKPRYAFRYEEFILMPLGILNIATVLKTKGHDVKIIDAYAERLSVHDLVQRIFSGGFDIVGISVLTAAYPLASKLTFEIKANTKNGRPLVVMGGPHATLLPEQVMEEVPVDFLIQGEGEYAFAEFVTAIENSQDVDHVPGIYFRKNGIVCKGPENKFLKNLDDLPPLDYSLLNMDLYKAPVQWSPPLRMYNIMTARGCPFHCPFCANNQLHQGVSHHSIERIHHEIETLLSEYDCHRFMVSDSIFPSNHKRGLEFLNMMIGSGWNRRMTWFCQTRIELLNEEFVALAKRAGCARISLGIESGDPDILRSIHKNFLPEDAIRTSKMIRKHGIYVSANFMFGHVGETFETMQRTSSLSRAMDLDEAAFFILVPYPGTKTFELAKKTHGTLSHDWNDYLKSGKFLDQEVPFVPKGLSANLLIHIRRSAFFKFYLRPKIIWRDLRRMGPYYFTIQYLLKGAKLLQALFHKVL